MTALEQTPAVREDASRPSSKALSGSAALGVLLYALRRLAFGVVVLAAIVFLTYLGLAMAGGDSLGPAAATAARETLAYAGRFLHGDLGLTIAGSDTALPRPVGEVILERLPRSLGLLGLSLLLATLVGVGLGLVAARSRSQRSLIILLATLVGVSVPSFFAAFLLQWAVVASTRQLGRSLLPVGGFGWDKHLILPVLVLSARPIAQITRIAFVSLRQVLAEDYVRTAQSKGLHRRRVMAVHVMRNVAIPILTTMGLSLHYALSSLPVVELYFGWPGVGLTLLKGISQRDDNLTVALVLCLGVLFILVNLALELSYRLIDPRLRQTPAHIATRERVGLLEAVRGTANWLLDLIQNSIVVRWVRRSRTAKEPVSSSATHPSAEKQASALDVPGTRRPRRWTAPLRNAPLIVGSLLVLGLSVIVFFGPQLSPNNPSQTQPLLKIDGKFVSPPYAPGGAYPWGTDMLGRGLMSLIFAGARQTLLLAVLAVAARTVVGVTLGAVAGWTRDSYLDRLILGLAEIIAAFPALLLAMVLILALGIRRGMPPFVVALCFVGWGEIMQFVRSQVIAIRPRPYIESAVAVGARSPRILGRHILPHLFAALTSIVALEMGSVLMLLGELGFVSIFIGGGTVIAETSGRLVIHSDVPEWGALLSNLRHLARSYPWTALYPMLAFFAAIVSFNLLGEGIRRLLESGSLVINRFVNRYTVAMAVIAVVLVRWLGANSGVLPFYQQRALTFDGDYAMAHVAALSSQDMEGRALGSPGMDRAAEYIAEQFEALGLQAGGQQGTYFQERAHSFERLDALPALHIDDDGPVPVYGEDFSELASLYVSEGEADGAVRFVCLGQPLNIQTAIWRPTYVQLERTDFGDDILLVPSARDADIVHWKPKGGLLVVAEEDAQPARRATIGARPRGRHFPRLLVSEDTAERLVRDSGYDLAGLMDACHGLPPEQMLDVPLSSRASISVSGDIESKWPVRHVIGYIPGTHSYDYCVDCLGKQLIVVMAQYDGPPVGPDGSIYPAANDNASGIAVMLEAIRVIQETDYQPYKSMLFVAYAGEGLDGGESVSDPDVRSFLQARAGLSKHDVEAIIKLRGVGGGSGSRLEVAAGGSLRLANLLSRSARRLGVRTVRANEAMDMGLVYDQGSADVEDLEEAPTARLYWEGWEEHARTSDDTLGNVSADSLERAGRSLALALMVLGREREY